MAVKVKPGLEAASKMVGLVQGGITTALAKSTVNRADLKRWASALEEAAALIKDIEE